MAQLINLRQARKRRDRALAEQRAAENRALHGMGKAERLRIRRETARADAALDGAMCEPAPPAADATPGPDAPNADDTAHPIADHAE